MNRFFRKKAVVAICFSIGLLAGLFFSIQTLAVSLELENGITAGIAKLEASINEQFAGKDTLLELYGSVQELLMKNEVNGLEVVKDTKGFLHEAAFTQEPSKNLNLVKELHKFRLAMVEKEVKLLYVMTPDRYIPGYTELPNGIPYSYTKESADYFLKGLSKYKIDHLDLRDYLKDSGIENSNIFYKTDEHWKVETAFWAFTCLLEQLEEEYDFPVESRKEVSNLKNYNSVTYKNSYLGSLGRKNGITYSGVDDFTLLYPKFYTDYVYTATKDDVTLETKGKFEQALLNMEPFTYEGSQYDEEADKYSSFLYGEYETAHIHNNASDGPKVLMVKDSAMTPVAAFLSTVCSDIYLIDPASYNGDITEYANEIEDLDYVLVSYASEYLTSE